ncbi:MAG: peptidylprolyl isomerase fpr4 [Peltula sp. TS41687]|nr:MAG: peptidylprolyl isomerase fpr4 [Peltula sp. TS41687]
MSSLVPVAFYGLEVPSGDVLISGALMECQGSYRITMAAIDPSAEPHLVEPTGNNSLSPRATLKIVRQNPDLVDSDDYDSEEDLGSLKALLGAGPSDDEDEKDSDDDEEVNGGPSDPSKTKKARKAKELADLKKAMDEDDGVEMDADARKTNGVNGTSPKKGKGKAKATEEDIDVDDDDDDDEDEEGLDLEEFVVCTLDPTKQYQQPLDITVGEDEHVYFKVSGTHTVYLTGNYVLPADEVLNTDADRYDSDDEEYAYDLSPDEDELDSEEESDELDDQPDPRVMELGTDDEEEVPKLVKQDEKKKLPMSDVTQKEKKSKNKRAAADDENDTPSNLDDIMAKSLKPEEGASNTEQPKLSKKQLKKLKNNAGQAVPPATQDDNAKKDEKPTDGTKPVTTKSDKKVQFAKDLESPGKNGEMSGHKSNSTEKTDTPKATLGPKTVQGVLIDDKKLGTGPQAKKGDKVAVRYIGKLQSNNLVFDANKAGNPFEFKLGAGDVIKGWDIGVAGMAVNGERRFTVPPKLAYGNKKNGKIPANSTLVFEVKLLSIEPTRGRSG